MQVTVRLTQPDAAGHLDQAPVSVNIISAQARGVLAVPVSALVALAGGGYAVDVVQGSTVHLVAVQTGLFSQTLVQVSGSRADRWPARPGAVVMTAVLELAGVSKSYPGSPPVTALAAVHLTIHQAERTAVLGPSGSGKTTLLHVAGTLERPSSGRVMLGGQEVSALSDAELSAVRGRRLGFVFQQFHLLDHLDAVQNVALGLLHRGEPARVRRSSAVDALERVGLGHRLGHRPAQLSGGERQRVAIARAVAGHPDVVLADEPTGNLDSVAGQQIIDLLARLAADGTAIVVVTHDPAVAAAMDRHVVMQDGQIVSDDRPVP